MPKKKGGADLNDFQTFWNGKMVECRICLKLISKKNAIVINGDKWQNELITSKLSEFLPNNVVEIIVCPQKGYTCRPCLHKVKEAHEFISSVKKLLSDKERYFCSQCTVYCRPIVLDKMDSFWRLSKVYCLAFIKVHQ